jgi:hypothetical protein
MKKLLLSLAVLISGGTMKAQVGMNSQYIPGGQIGFVSVSGTGHPNFDKISFGAGLPLLMFDRLGNHWYSNLDLSALYYGATQTNKANDNRIAISKAEGAICNGRLGYTGGDGDQYRIGGYLGFGWSTSNLDSIVKPFDYKSYLNWSIGVIGYKKFGKLRTIAKLAYEIYTAKNYISRGSGFYFEGTVGYSFYQKYGISVMPCFYHKGFTYWGTDRNDQGNVVANVEASVNSFVLKFGLCRFF